MDKNKDDKQVVTEKLYRYISKDEFKIVTQVAKGVTPNRDIYGNLKTQYSISDKYDSQDEWEKGYGSAYMRQANGSKTAWKSTSFPEIIEILVRDNNSKEPLNGIAIGIRLFASIKNDYFFIADLSDKDGIINITKDMLYNEIKNTRNLFVMDYASDLRNCKPYIEIIADDMKTIKKRLDWMTQVATVYEPVKRGVRIFSNCKNHIINCNRINVNLNQGTKKQKILFSVEKKRGDGVKPLV